MSAKELFESSNAPIYWIMDNEDVNMANAQVRDVEGGCVYVDDVDGWEFHAGKEAKSFLTPGDGSYLALAK